MKIGKYNVDAELILEYIKHLNDGFKKDAQSYENKRKRLHEEILRSVKVKRHTKQGEIFSRQLDEFCESMITDKIIKLGKKISNAKDMTELEKINKALFSGESHALSNETEKARQRLKEKGSDMCRICKKSLIEGVARANDHLTDMKGFETPDLPICMDCSSKNPDDYHKEFKRRYWDK